MGTLCSIKNGKSNAEDADESGAYAFFDRSKKVKRSTRYLYDCEALIIPGEGAEFLPRHFVGKFDLHQRAYALFDFSPSIDVRFLFYYLINYKDYFIKVAVGATVKSLRLRHFEQLPVPVAPIEEQQRIVGILDDAFDRIATAKANAEKNLQNARALFPSVINSALSSSGLGPGWLKTTIGEQIMLQRGFDITKEQQRPGGVPVVSSGGVKSFHDTAMVHGPGVVIGRKGTLGKVFYLEDDFWPHDTTLWVKKFNGNEPRFVYYFLTSLDVTRLDSGSANPALNRNQVHPIKVNWPPISKQKAIAEKLDTIGTEAKRLESVYRRKLAALDELKKSLLHKAFTGEL
jgi:type I restriction enzyme S subunit